MHVLAGRSLLICLALYSQYFENEQHPSSDETLLKAARDAGIPEDDARTFIQDTNEGKLDLQLAIREQKGNTDAVPFIIVSWKSTFHASLTRIDGGKEARLDL